MANYYSSWTGAQMDSILAHVNSPDRLNIMLSIPADIVCTTAGTWYDVGGTWSDGVNKNFTYDDSGGEFIYTGVNDHYFAFRGSSVAQASGASTITYGLFLDDGDGYDHISKFDTPMEWTASERSKTLVTLGYSDLVIDTGYKFKVMVKSDTDLITVSPYTLQVEMKYLAEV